MNKLIKLDQELINKNHILKILDTLSEVLVEPNITTDYDYKYVRDLINEISGDLDEVEKHYLTLSLMSAKGTLKIRDILNSTGKLIISDLGLSYLEDWKLNKEIDLIRGSNAKKILELFDIALYYLLYFLDSQTTIKRFHQELELNVEISTDYLIKVYNFVNTEII